MHFSNFSVLDFKGIQLNLIETNSVKFHEVFESLYENAQRRNTNFKK